MGRRRDEKTPGDGLKRILKYLDSLKTLYTSAVVSLAINQTQEDVRKLKKCVELKGIEVGRDEAKPAQHYEAEAVARHLGKPVCKVRCSLNVR